MVSSRRRRWWAGLTGVILTGAVVACGGDDDDAVSGTGGAGAGGQVTAGSSGQAGASAGLSGSSGQTTAGSAGQTAGGQAGATSAGGASGGAGSSAGTGGSGATGGAGDSGGAAGEPGGSAGKGGAGGGTSDKCAPLFGGAMLGATIDGSAKIASASVDKFKALGVKSVRVYVSIKWGKNSGQNQPANDSAINAVKLLHSAGLHVVMAIVGSDGAEPTDAQQTRDTFKVLVEDKGLKDVVDIWELGNEPDHASYWKSANIGTYSTKYLLPAAKLLHTYTKGGNPLQVANAPPSYSVDHVKQMLGTVDPEDTSAACKKDKSKCATARDHVDYVNLHFYRTDLTNKNPGDKYPQDLRTFLGLLNEAAAGKPTMATEWSMNKPGNDKQAWADLIKHAWQDDCLIRDSLAIAHYYTWTADLSQPHGADGVFVADTSGSQAKLTPNEPFYTMFSDFE